MDIRPSSAAVSLQSHTGQWQIDVEPGVRLREPLYVRCAPGDRVRLTVGEGAQLTIVEEHMLGEDNGWSGDVALHLGARSKVAYISLLALPPAYRAMVHHAALVGQGASLTWHLATIGGSSVDHTLRSEVIGEGGESTVNWLFRASGRERQVLSVRNVFTAREGRGEVTMKGIAEAQAHVSARGVIEIGPGGGGTDTYLTQAVLMLDPTAKVDAVPALEIKTNDVKASHSASVACVSPEDLFYVASRGIPEPEARRMIIEGFLGELVLRIPDEEQRDVVRRAIEGF